MMLRTASYSSCVLNIASFIPWLTHFDAAAENLSSWA